MDWDNVIQFKTATNEGPVCLCPFPLTGSDVRSSKLRRYCRVRVSDLALIDNRTRDVFHHYKLPYNSEPPEGVARGVTAVERCDKGFL